MLRELARLALKSVQEKDFIVIVNNYHHIVNTLNDHLQGNQKERMENIKRNPLVILMTHRIKNVLLSPDVDYLRAKSIVERLLDNGCATQFQTLDGDRLPTRTDGYRGVGVVVSEVESGST